MILIGMGANLPSCYGGPEESLCAAARVLEERGVHVLRLSGFWRSAPVPVSGQPWYVNAVALVETDLDVRGLMALLHEVEASFGRDRVSEARNAARVLDLDLLCYGGDVFEAGGIVLPHPRLHERAFVLYPLREVALDWRHPVSGLCAEEMMDALPAGQIVERIEILPGRVA